MTLPIPNQSLKLILKNWYPKRVATTSVITVRLMQAKTRAAPRTLGAMKVTKVIYNVLSQTVVLTCVLQAMIGTNWKERLLNVRILSCLKQISCMF